MWALVVSDKSERGFQYHPNTLAVLKELLAAAGLSHPRELGPEHLIRRVSSTKVRSLAALHTCLQPRELLNSAPQGLVFKVFWNAARSDSFDAPPNILSMRSGKARRSRDQEGSRGQSIRCGSRGSRGQSIRC